jgi:NitT/TauT family transport system substrate-binding protein
MARRRQQADILGPVDATAIYLKAARAAKIGQDDVAEMLRGGTMTYAVTPTGIMQFARFMAKTRRLKAAPAAWQDVFFPLIHGRDGG